MSNKMNVTEHVYMITSDTGAVTYYRSNPTAGMTDAQVKTYNSIPGSEQAAFKKGVFEGRYPSNYLSFTASDPAYQDDMDFLSLYNKVNSDPAYLNSLSDSEFQSMMNEYVTEMGNRLTAINAGCYTMTDAEFAAADDATKLDAVNKSQALVAEWNEKLMNNKTMLSLHAPDVAIAMQNGLDQSREYVTSLFPPVSMRDDGSFYLIDPNAGLTDDQIATMNSIKDSSSQFAYRKAQLDYPDDYLETKVDDPVLQAELDRLSLFEKLNNASYLSTLKSDELQTLVTKGIEEFEAHGANFDEKTIETWTKCVTEGKSTEELIKQDLIGYLRPELVSLSPEDKKKMLDEYSNSVETSQPAAGQNGVEPVNKQEGSYFNNIKERVSTVFEIVKDAIESTAVGAWVIDKCEEIYDKFMGKSDDKNKQSESGGRKTTPENGSPNTSPNTTPKETPKSESEPTSSPTSRGDEFGDMSASETDSPEVSC